MSAGRTLIFVGLALLLVGVLILIGERSPVRLGRLPGDIIIRNKNSTFYFPIVSCLVVSALLSLVFWIIGKR